jgi:ethanolamine permease
LFALRQKQPNLDRPFKVPGYPFVPALALVLSFISLGAIVYYNFLLSGIFFGVLLMMIIAYFVQQKVIAHS